MSAERAITQQDALLRLSRPRGCFQCPSDRLAARPVHSGLSKRHRNATQYRAEPKRAETIVSTADALKSNDGTETGSGMRDDLGQHTLRWMSSMQQMQGKELSLKHAVLTFFMAKPFMSERPYDPFGAIDYASASRVLLWRRSDNLCYALLLGGQPEKGESVMTKVKGLIKVDDEETGPSTKREYEIARVPVGEALFGISTDFLGRIGPGRQPLGADEQVPLFNEQASMDDREQIAEPLLTGIKVVDTITPIGRGQALLVVGAPGSGKTSLTLDAIMGQREQDVQCIYASVGQSEEESSRQAEILRLQGALSYTSIVSAASSHNLGQRFAALCAACSRGEKIRDAGGHALVVLDDVRCLVEMWEHISEVLVEIGISVAPPSEENDNSSMQEGTAVEEELVSYEGMLVSAAAAQRRQFFSSLVQRAAKLHTNKGGGSLTLLLVLPGTPATGRSKKKPDLSKFQHLAPATRAKLEAALAAAGGQEDSDDSKTVRTEVVEEFMSLADGQAVLRSSTAYRAEQPVSPSLEASPSRGDSLAAGFGLQSSCLSLPDDVVARAIQLDAAASVSRIGGRALYPALRELALSARLDLVQALDADQFSATKSDPANASALQKAQQLSIALSQTPGSFVPLEGQVAVLFAAQSGQLKGVQNSDIPAVMSRYIWDLQEQHPDLMSRDALTEELPQHSIDKLLKTLKLLISRHHAAVSEQ